MEAGFYYCAFASVASMWFQTKQDGWESRVCVLQHGTAWQWNKKLGSLHFIFWRFVEWGVSFWVSPPKRLDLSSLYGGSSQKAQQSWHPIWNPWNLEVKRRIELLCYSLRPHLQSNTPCEPCSKATSPRLRPAVASVGREGMGMWPFSALLVAQRSPNGTNCCWRLQLAEWAGVQGRKSLFSHVVM